MILSNVMLSSNVMISNVILPTDEMISITSNYLLIDIMKSNVILPSGVI